jgi:hypothetical protein
MQALLPRVRNNPLKKNDTSIIYPSNFCYYEATGKQVKDGYVVVRKNKLLGWASHNVSFIKINHDV